MTVTFHNTNGFEVFLCADGKNLLIPAHGTETFSRPEDGVMTLVSRIARPSYTNKPKRRFWNFSFYHDYHLVLKTTYRVQDVRDGDVFRIITESMPLFEPENVIYERCSVYPARKTECYAQYSVFGDRDTLKSNTARMAEKTVFFIFSRIL